MQPAWFSRVCEAMLGAYPMGWSPCRFKRRHTVDFNVNGRRYSREVCNLHFRRFRDGKTVTFIVPVGE